MPDVLIFDFSRRFPVVHAAEDQPPARHVRGRAGPVLELDFPPLGPVGGGALPGHGAEPAER